jgi:hypothetical protein
MMRSQSTGCSLQRPHRAVPYAFAAAADPDDEAPNVAGFHRTPQGREDLPYKVELWDADKKTVEQVLAVTAHSSIGFAAYYAAAREYPERYVTLRHKNSIVARANGPDH